MAAGDFFRRKGLLPNKGVAQEPPASAFESSKASVPSLRPELAAEANDDAFSRPTLVPDTPGQEQEWGLDERFPTSPAPASTDNPAFTAQEDVAFDERVTLSTNEIPRANFDFVDPRALEVQNFATRETIREMPESGRSSQRPDSGHGALGFVDALPRVTSIPPERTSHLESGPPSSERVSIVSLSELYALSDFSGALEMAEARLAANPSDTEAQRYAQDCRRVLIKMQLSRLGSLQQVVELALDASELQWLTIDHRAGFLLSLIDGLSTLEDLLDICGMQRLEALQIFADLVEQKVVRLRPLVTA
jgi:hypothetical protein